MAIGARRLHVLLRILAASVSLRVTGGIAGIIISVGFSTFISLVAGWSAPISAAGIARGFLFSAAVGIFFGDYATRKAAQLDPIEGMRFEYAASLSRRTIFSENRFPLFAIMR